MIRLGGPATITALLSFNAGFVDAASFLGLDGLFTAHVTGNFVTLGAALVMGSHGIVNKLLALPEFIMVVALARLAGAALRARKAPVLRVFLIAEVVLLAAFFALAVGFGPFEMPTARSRCSPAFSESPPWPCRTRSSACISASEPPTTIMTGNTTQATIDAVDLLMGAATVPADTRARFVRVALGIVWFALGCATSALLYWWVGFWCLALAVLVARWRPRCGWMLSSSLRGGEATKQSSRNTLPLDCFASLAMTKGVSRRLFSRRLAQRLVDALLPTRTAFLEIIQHVAIDAQRHQLLHTRQRRRLRRLRAGRGLGGRRLEGPLGRLA